MLVNTIISNVNYNDDLTTATVTYATGETEICDTSELLSDLNVRLRDQLTCFEIQSQVNNLSTWGKKYIKNYLDTIVEV